MSRLISKWCGVAMLLALPIVLAGCDGGSPESVAKGFMQAMADGKPEAVKKYLHPDDLKSAGPMLDMVVPKAAQSLQEEKKGLKSISVVSNKVDGDVAHVKLKCSYGDGSSEEVDAKCVRKDGKWYPTMDMDMKMDAGDPGN